MLRGDSKTAGCLWDSRGAACGKFPSGDLSVGESSHSAIEFQLFTRAKSKFHVSVIIWCSLRSNGAYICGGRDGSFAEKLRMTPKKDKLPPIPSYFPTNLQPLTSNLYLSNGVPHIIDKPCAAHKESAGGHKISFKRKITGNGFQIL